MTNYGNLLRYGGGSHAKFHAHEPSRDGGEGVDRLGRALFDASVDLNPHQIEAALFALRNPLLEERIIICSFHYAARLAKEIKPIPWDLVVIDEAHKLRNAYRESNRR